MPIYTFKCPSCSKVKDITQGMNEPPPICKDCTNASCGVHLPEMKRVWKPNSKPQFKGDGFYETDYKEKSKSE